MQPQFQETGKK